MTKKIFTLLLAAFFSTFAYSGFTLSIPADQIEAEAYNNGGEGVGFHDLGGSPTTETNSDGGANIHIGYIDGGEWLAYTVSVTSGFYYLDARVAKDASAPAGGAFHIEIGGADVTGVQTVPATGGWTTFATMNIGPIEIPVSGSQTMKIVFDGGPFNLNWVKFTTTSESPSPSPSPTPAPTASPAAPVISALHVEGQYIKNSSGGNVVLRGASLSDLHVINKGDRKTDSTQATAITVEELIDKGSEANGWYIDAWRLPIHADVNDETGHHGWNVVNNPQLFFDNIIEPAVSKVISVGKYVIIDWHYVGVSWDDATVIAKTEEFWLGNGSWTGIAAHYADNPNVLFELFNEPGGGSWSSWKTRASGWIDGIRAKGADNIIIVGGPGWSQTLPSSTGELFTQANIVYANHIYPAHVSGSMPSWIEFTAQYAPVMMTEWGFENTGPVPVSGTASAYGSVFKNYINSKPNVSWIGWCFDYIYHSYWFDTNWTLLGNGNATASTLYYGASGIDGGSHGMTAPSDTSENFMGQFVKNWLAEAHTGGTSAPTAAPTATPTAGPTTPPTSAPTAAPTAPPTSAPTAAPTAPPAGLIWSGGPIAFNGTSDYQTLPTSVANTADFTFAARVDWNGGSNWQRIFDFGLDTNKYMFLTPGNGSNMIFAITTSGNSGEQKISVSTLAANTSKHVAVTISGNTGKLYVDGAEAGSNTSMTINPSDMGATNCWLGKSQYSADAYFGGDMDQVKIYNYALSASEISALAAGGSTSAPTAAPTQAPTGAPTQAPTAAPTQGPTADPTAAPTQAPTADPTAAPTAPPGGGCITISSGTNTGNLGTTGAYCFQTQLTINGWGVSNFDGRTISVTVNGTGTAVTTPGAALPAKGSSDYYVFQATAGSYEWAAIYWW